MAVRVSSEGVVLRRSAYREADLIVTLLSAEQGVLSAVARAARRSQRRFGAALELFTVARFELERRGGSELWQLQSAALVERHTDLALDPASLVRASYGTELVRELCPPEQPEPGVFAALVELYRVLRAVEPAQVGVDSVLRAFELRLLDELGLAPVLAACVRCGQASKEVLARGVVLDQGQGGIACRACAATCRGVGVTPLSGAAREFLVALQQAGSLAAAPATLRPPGRELAQASQALMGLVAAHAAHPLRSVGLLAALGGPGDVGGP